MSSKRILVIHFGQLGDSVSALPAMHALRDHFPEARLTILTSKAGAELFRMEGYDSVWPVDRIAWKYRPVKAMLEIPPLIFRLRQQRFELSVDFHTYKETNLLAWAAGIPERVAMLRPTRSFPRLITLKPPPDNPDGILVHRYCKVLEPLGIQVQDPIPRLIPPPWADSKLAEKFATFEEDPILGVCPGAGHPSRRWPPEHFAAVIRALSNGLDSSLRVLIFPGPEESGLTLAPLRALPEVQCLNVMPLPEFCAALGRCQLVLANDSGPAHLAAAVGTPVVTIGAPPHCQPIGDVIAVRPVGRILDIPVHQVIEAVKHMWNKSTDKRNSSCNP